jgi:AraC-like DNA-binding protein/mannose-6-phosphate isomerase-like protein (cupin superfamily)
MQKDGYQNISAKLAAKEIGLGWLSGITAWRTSRAVSMDSHQHPHIELLFCLKGNLIYEISSYGAITVSEGSGLVIPAHTRHILKDGTDAPCERLGLHVTSTICRRCPFRVFTPADFKILHSTLMAKAAFPFHLDSKLLASVKELAALIYDESKSSIGNGFLRALCCTILYRTAEILSKPIIPAQPQMMDEAIRFLEENYARKIGIDDLAQRMGYGRTRLFHLFKQHTGLTPNEYLVRYRIDMAKELIRKHSMPINKIARATGFSTESYFRSVFKKYTGHDLESMIPTAEL